MATRNYWGNWIIGGVCGRQRVATTCRFISLNIDALTSAASSARCNATEKEGHVNYDVLNVPVEACAAPTTGRGCTVEYWRAHDDAKNPLFFGGGEMAVQVYFCG